MSSLGEEGRDRKRSDCSAANLEGRFPSQETTSAQALAICPYRQRRGCGIIALSLERSRSSPMKFIMMSSLAVVLFPVFALSGQSADQGFPDQARTILGKAAAFQLYSLDPDEEEKPAEKPTRLHGYKVLGKTTLKRVDDSGKAVLTAFELALDKGLAAKCFEPRHAIHAEYDGKTVDLLICFECALVYVYLDGKNEETAVVTISRYAQPIFDTVLRDAKIILAKKKKE
jgi:hypothetical protein